MDALPKKLDAMDCACAFAEVINLADQDILDLVRSRVAEQEVLDLIDEPNSR